MRRTLGWVMALAVPAILLTGPFVSAQKKPLDKDLDKNSEKMIRAGQLVGQVVSVYEDKKKIRLKVGQVVQEFNPSAAQAMQNAQVQLAQAQRQRPINYQSIRSAQLAMAQAQAQPLYKAKMVWQEGEVQVMDDAIVRSRHPRLEFDDKGRPKKPTPKELKELKGTDPKLPGYKAEFGDIQPEQVIMVQLVRKKGAGGGAAPVKAPKGKGKMKEGEAADLLKDVLSENEPQASMIVIEREPAPPPAGK